ncbi:ABC transporter permease [Lentilactobacillus senioris]|uniref:ABC transporter permease n=1 Tax=Lentilactobacillus senioris TaxID=931534 RepID=UPI002282B9C3|nr:ABC transporter permease [Lentilactobacillus senioris]MCY9806261.1 ABC transporter permease [Lentilactobacillus senioris]
MTQFAETKRLLLADLKRDRIKIIVWMLVLAGLFLAVAYKFTDLYGNPSQINTIAETLKSKAMESLFGPLARSTNLNTAIIFASEMLIFWAIFMVIFNYSLAIGSTRGQEESGLTEMIRGGHPVGRQAPLLAATLELTLIDGLFTILSGVGLQLADLPGANTNGNWLLALALGIVGWAFGMIALVFAQLFNDAHNAMLSGYLFFGVTYLVRMITDVTNPDWTWLSPLGWVEKTSIYVDNNWLPMILYAVTGFAMLAIAFALNANRDIDAGIIAVRPGKQTSNFLAGPGSLLFWTQKTTALVWIAGVFVLGASYGSVFDSIGKLVKTSPVIQEVLGTSGVQHAEKLQVLNFVGILGMIFSILAVIAGGMIVNKIETDNQKGYLGLVGAKPISRNRNLATVVAYGSGLAVIVLVSAIAGTQAAANAVMRHPLAAHYYWQTGLAMVPVILLLIGLLVALIGWLPKWRSLTWGYLGLAFVLSYFGKLLKLPEWSLRISPFYWLNKVPVEKVDWTAWWLILGIAVILLVAGFIGYNRRDLDR